MMNRLYPILAGLLLTLLSARAQGLNVTLEWNANTEPLLAGYVVYAGTNTGNYHLTNTVTGTSYNYPNLDAGFTWFFAVTAQDIYGLESDLSDEVSYDGGWLPALAAVRSHIAVKLGGRTNSTMEVTLEWHPPTITNLLGYTITYGTNAASRTVVQAGPAATNYTIVGLPIGPTQHMSVSYRDSTGRRSVESEDVSVSVTRLRKPAGQKVTGRFVIRE